jgi:hypothetical protein
VHKGRCLSPYLSLQAQGVSDGDTVVLCPVPEPPRQGRHRRAPPKSGIFHEVVRLADVAFHPFEASEHGATLYRQMLAEARRREPPPKMAAPSVIPEEMAAPCVGPLPACWPEERTPRRRAFRPRAADAMAPGKQAGD